MDRKWWTLIAVCVGTFMLLLDVTIVNVALPAIQTSLKASFSDLQWVVDAYALMLAALLLTTGSLADLWGRRLIFVIGLVVFTGSSLASGLAQSPLWLNLARGAQGVGGSAMFSTSLALLGSSFQGRERGVAFGVWGAITGLAVAVGPVVGGALTTGLSWRWIFLVNVPIGIVAVAISLARVPESRMPYARRPDVIGVLTFSGALGALVYALIKGDTKGWGTPVILGCLIGAGVLLVAFLIAEWAQPHRAMFDLKLFRKPTFTGGLLTAFALSGGLFALFLYLTLYFQDVLGYSALQTGIRFIVLSGGILLTSTMAGRLTAHVPIRFLIAPGLVLVGVGLLLMRGVTATSGWTHLIPGFIVAGAGTGLINPPLASTAIGVVRPERAGMASGINSTFRQVGIATGIAGLGAIFTHAVRTRIIELLHGAPGISAAQASTLAASVAHGHGVRAGLHELAPQAQLTAAHALRSSFAHGLNLVFLVGAVLSLVVAALTLVLIRSKDFEEGHARVAAGPSNDSAEPLTISRPSMAAAQAPADAGEPGHDYAPEPEPRLQPLSEPELRLEPRSAAPFDDQGPPQPIEPPPPLAPPPLRPGPVFEPPRERQPERLRTHEAAPSGQNGNDVPMTSDRPPSARDMRLVEAAVQGAEEAALAYAREIGEARRHLAKAIEHLDRAEEARLRLNRHATGFMGPEAHRAAAAPRAAAGPASAPPPFETPSTPEAASFETPRASEASRSDAPRAPEAPRSDAPRAPEAPRSDAPRAPEAPPTEAPEETPPAEPEQGPGPSVPPTPISVPHPGIAVAGESAISPPPPPPSWGAGGR